MTELSIFMAASGLIAGFLMGLAVGYAVVSISKATEIFDLTCRIESLTKKLSNPARSEPNG